MPKVALTTIHVGNARSAGKVRLYDATASPHGSPTIAAFGAELSTETTRCLFNKSLSNGCERSMSNDGGNYMHQVLSGLNRSISHDGGNYMRQVLSGLNRSMSVDGGEHLRHGIFDTTGTPVNPCHRRDTFYDLVCELARDLDVDDDRGMRASVTSGWSEDIDMCQLPGLDTFYAHMRDETPKEYIRPEVVPEAPSPQVCAPPHVVAQAL